MAIEDFGAKEKPLQDRDGHRRPPEQGRHRLEQGAQWFEREGVDTATELVTTSVALAVMKVAKEKNRIALISGAASTPITNEQCNDVTVHYTYDTYALANGTAKAVTQQGGKTWFFLTADYAFGQALEKDPGRGQGQRRPWSGSVRHLPGLRLLVLPAAGPGLGRAGHRPGQRRRRHHQRHQAGGRVRHHAHAVAGRPADVHHRRPRARPEADAGHVPDDGFYWDRNDETRAWSKRFFEKQKKMPTMVQAGQYSSVYHYLKAVKAATGRHGQGHGQDEEAPINDFFAKNGRSATTAAWCTTCTWCR
jgi:branched-chain amino acid transport system substrate-binding protein